MKKNGFTLIEIIVTLTIVAVAGALFVAYMGTSLTQSAVPASQVRSQYALIQQMEEITSDYRKALNDGGGTINLQAFKVQHVDTKPNIYSVSEIILMIGALETQSKLLQVTLRDGDQYLFAVFTSGEPR